jgi:hypothetical protein
MRNFECPLGILRCTSQLMNVNSNMVNVRRREESVLHSFFLIGCLFSRYAKRYFMKNSSAMEVNPIAASTFIRGSPLSVLMMTLYGASRVLMPVIPSATGNCVDMMVILAAVTKAEMGTYGMNSMTQPSRSRPQTKRIVPAMSESAFAVSSLVKAPGRFSLTLDTTSPTSSDPTAVV